MNYETLVILRDFFVTSYCAWYLFSGIHGYYQRGREVAKQFAYQEEMLKMIKKQTEDEKK